MGFEKSRLRWLAALSTVLSLVACYGTLAVIAVLGMLGTVIALNETVWAGAIVVFTSIAAVGLVMGFLRHRRPWPVLVGGLGAVAIATVMLVQYDRLIEVAGFVLLCAGAVWDWRSGRNPRP